MAKKEDHHKEHPVAKAEVAAAVTLVEAGNSSVWKPDHYRVGAGGKRFEVSLPNAVVFIIDAPSDTEAVKAYDKLSGVIDLGDRSHLVVELADKPTK